MKSAQQASIIAFAHNLKKLLLTAPVKGKVGKKKQ